MTGGEGLEGVIATWLGKTVLGVIAFGSAVAAGWWTSRANIMGAVNKRVNDLMGHLEKEIDRLTKAHETCETNLATVRQEVEQIRGELRQTKQTIESMERIK